MYITNQLCHLLLKYITISVIDLIFLSSRFVVKVGLASAAVYYINRQGLWRSSDDSIKTYMKLKENVNPYIQQAKSQIPYEAC